MILEAHCKFCKRDLHLSIDDDYATLKDPFGLIPFAACNRCADFYSSLRPVKESIHKIAVILIPGHVGDDARAQCRAALERLTKRYVKLIADYMSVPTLVWDEVIVEHIMRKPAHFGEALGNVWRAARDEKQRLL